MCGIFGLVSPSGVELAPGDESALRRGMDAIARRGPDGQGIWKNETVLLGHLRLAIIDPDERSNQPMESSNWVICYNGEIYNFRAIRADLESIGHRFQTSSDTEVLLLALEQWGIEGTLSRIAGMFAFVAHNKATGTSYVARDHMGIKPVVYSTDDRGVMYVASSVAGILKARSSTRFDIDRPALASYFVLGGAMTDSTCYTGIERLPPAHYIEINPDGRTTLRRFWTPQHQPAFTMDDLIGVVAEYEISDVKSAMFLSGGVDSSFLATTFQELDCFHLVSPEEDYARAVAKRFDRYFISVNPDLADFERDVEEAIGFHGEPLMSVGIPLSVSREISRKGYKMAISANGADELFHGYSRTPTPEYSPPYLPLHERPSKRFFGEQLAHIFRDSRNFAIEGLDDLLPSLHDIGLDAMARYQLPDFAPSASHRWLELMTYVLSDLNPTLDAASMYHSVEVRVPFLDHRIVQGVLSWDASRMVTPTLGRKAPLKAHLANYFPQALYQREKLGFSIHVEKLETISDLSNKALSDAIDRKFIRMGDKNRIGEYYRDIIYLGSCLFAFSKWDGRLSLDGLPAYTQS